MHNCGASTPRAKQEVIEEGTTPPSTPRKPLLIAVDEAFVAVDSGELSIFGRTTALIVRCVRLAGGGGGEGTILTATIHADQRRSSVLAWSLILAADHLHSAGDQARATVPALDRRDARPCSVACCPPTTRCAPRRHEIRIMIRIMIRMQQRKRDIPSARLQGAASQPICSPLLTLASRSYALGLVCSGTVGDVLMIWG